jgi:hypothetical protein
VNDAWERGFNYAFVINNDILLHPEAIWRLVRRMRLGDVGIATASMHVGRQRRSDLLP